MSWPQASDFQDAVLNPQASFVDIDLRDASVVCNPTTSMPIAASGTFGIVYQMRSDDAPSSVMKPPKEAQPKNCQALVVKFIEFIQIGQFGQFMQKPRGRALNEGTNFEMRHDLPRSFVPHSQQKLKSGGLSAAQLKRFVSARFLLPHVRQNP